MEVPLLTQDEFFRHLELQSVHCVRFTYYRQALKERLRATTKRDSLQVSKNQTKKTNQANKNVCRRIVSRPKARKEKESCKLEDKGREKESLEKKSPLDQIYEFRKDQPRVRAEIEEIRSRIEQEQPSMVQDRLREIPSSSDIANRNSSYTCRIRIQRQTRSAEVVGPRDELGRREPIRPGSFPLNGREITLSNQGRNARADFEPRRRTKKDSTTSDKKTEDEALLLYPCKMCHEMFSTRSSQLDHEEKGHSAACRICKKIVRHAMRDEGVCDKCVSKMNYADKILLMKTVGLSSSLGLLRQCSTLNKCDICSKVFVKRMQMIKHVMTQHASVMHKVDLVKFVNRNKIRQRANYVGLEVR